MASLTALEPTELTEARRQLGLSQEALAKRIGISVATVGRWERQGVAAEARSKTSRALRELEELIARRELASPTFKFFSRDDVSAASAEWAGYEDQTRVAVTLGQNAVRQSRAESVLVFGLPGTGKSAFAWAVAKALQDKGLPFSLLHVPCGQLAVGDPQVVRDSLREIESIVAQSQHYPMVIVLDEADAMLREQRHTSGLISFWCMSLLKWIEDFSRPALLLAIADNPGECDMWLLSRIGPSIYLRTPDVHLATLILARKQVDAAGVVAKELMRLMGDSEVVMTGRSLVEALKLARQLEPDFSAMDAHQKARLLFGLIPSVPEQEVTSYRKRNRWKISSADALASVVEKRAREDDTEVPPPAHMMKGEE